MRTMHPRILACLFSASGSQNMSLLKRIALLTLKVLGVFALLVALGVGVLYWQTRNAETEYEQFTVLDSSDGNHSLIIEIGNPGLPYGPHSVAVKVINISSSEVITAKNVRLANDGMTIDSGNISAHWIDIDKAGVCISGDEQRDNYLLINIQNQTVREKQGKCRE
jgi:hypothetical protein